MSSSLAQRIDRLFRTYLNPKGREYSYREVATAIARSEKSRRRGEAISAAYIWGLRTGVKDNPTLKHLQALSAFFQVSPSYFFDEELTELSDETRMVAATRRQSVIRLAIAALEMSEESLDVLLKLAFHLRQLESRSDFTADRLGAAHDLINGTAKAAVIASPATQTESALASN